jgi:hypothetical protein
VTLTADAGGGAALHVSGPEELGEDVVGAEDDDAEDDATDGDDDADAAAGFFESLLHAASGSTTNVAQTSRADRRNSAIGAVFHHQ